MKGLILGILLLTHLLSFSQLKETPMNDVDSILKKSPKNIVVFIHTDWCKYCLMQDKITFQDSLIVSELNQNYYCVRLNAEADQQIYFLNRMYTKKGNIHSLSWVLGAQNNELTFPTTVLLSPQYQITNRWVGYLSKEQLTVVN